MNPLALALPVAATLGLGLGAVGPALVDTTAAEVAVSAPTSPSSGPTRGVLPPAGTPGFSRATPTWVAPVRPLHVERRFDAPAQDWLAGHRGVDLQAPAGTVVTAPADGRVAFAGTVAGKPVLSVDHVLSAGDVVRTTYEPVAASVSAGESVRRGDPLGTVSGTSHCGGSCLHWGARRGTSYVDPLHFLAGEIRLYTPTEGLPRQRG